jgi:hypothetical protein
VSFQLPYNPLQDLPPSQMLSGWLSAMQEQANDGRIDPIVFAAAQDLALAIVDVAVEPAAVFHSLTALTHALGYASPKRAITPREDTL